MGREGGEVLGPGASCGGPGAGAGVTFTWPTTVLSIPALQLGGGE